MKILTLALLLPLLAAASFAADAPAPASDPAPDVSPRAVVAWDTGWLFSKTDPATAMAAAFEDAAWRPVRVPHDWSTEEPYRPEYGSGNGYAAGGIAWYRRHFKLDAAASGRAFVVEFDGVYDHSQVWLNGHYLGGRPFGYSSFAYELTPFLKFGGEDNVLAVRVDHSRFADSRWYTGSGIYRHVRLVATDPLRVAHWGTFVSTPAVTANAATVRVETTVQNGTGVVRAFRVQADILDAAGSVLATGSAPGSAPARGTNAITQNLTLPQPRLWSPDSPALYTLRTRVLDGATRRDETRTTFGVRTLSFDPDRGFALNGVPMKWKGVCLHHDAGPLGAAVPVQVWETRLRALQALGVNAIRTSHNPPAPELLDLCDRLGLLVKDESLDEFTPTKNKWVAGWNLGQPSRYGAGEFFAEWGVRDTADMVRRDRNHPSVILWSVGNEIDYPNDPFSHPVLADRYRPANPRAENLLTCAEPLVAAVKALDLTRPVTAALASIVMSNAVGLPEKLDVVGYNYLEQHYAADHVTYPRRFIFGSENSHSHAAWVAVRDNAYVAGQFLWTGIDYLGEARAWPNRANAAGLLDLCGFKKPQAWFRQSLWTDEPMVYIGVQGATDGRRATLAEHWNWAAGRTLGIACYTNAAEVELTLNGESLGVKPATAAVEGVLSWNVPYAPGALRAIARRDGREVASYTLTTAGPANRLELASGERPLRADAGDVAQIEFRVVDARGIRVPDAAPLVQFELAGPVELLAVGNANLSDPENCRDAVHAAYQGRGLAFVRRTDAAGPITIKVTAPGLAPATLTLDGTR